MLYAYICSVFFVWYVFFFFFLVSYDFNANLHAVPRKVICLLFVLSCSTKKKKKNYKKSHRQIETKMYFKYTVIFQV
jgi:hypothetical protein